jgi:hypothetical protein
MATIPELQPTPTNPSTTTTPTGPCEYGYLAGGPTTLRCARCTRPLLVKDAQHTPTGYVCRNYVKGRVAMFYTANPMHYTIVAAVALVGGLLAGLGLRLIGNIGFFSLIIMFVAAPAIGAGIAEVIRRALGKSRGQYFWLTASIAVVIGAAYFIILPPLVGLLGGRVNLISAIIPIIGLGLLVSAMVARMRI